MCHISIATVKIFLFKVVHQLYNYIFTTEAYGRDNEPDNAFWV